MKIEICEVCCYLENKLTPSNLKVGFKNTTMVAVCTKQQFYFKAANGDNTVTPKKFIELANDLITKSFQFGDDFILGKSF